LKKNLNKKKKILLVLDTHVHIAMSYYELLSYKYQIDTYWSSKYKNDANSYLKKKTKFFSYPQGLIYFFLIFKSFNYNYIFITTGPQEFNGKKGLIGIFGYLIFIFFHGKKTIMGIRDNNKYFRNNHSDLIEKILNFVRNISLKKINSLFFETKTLMKNFKKKINVKNINCFVIYPFHIVKKKIKIHRLNSKVLRIGVLGLISKERKNYNILINAINLFDKKVQNKIEIILMGGGKKNEKRDIVQNLRKKIKSKIFYDENYIREARYKKLASSCHVLLSINKKKYGSPHKGTGAFFDALSSKKPLIINFHSDRQFEFKNFCHYYSNAPQLFKIIKIFLKDIDKINSKKRNVFAKYNNDQAKYNLLKFLC